MHQHGRLRFGGRAGPTSCVRRNHWYRYRRTLSTRRDKKVALLNLPATRCGETYTVIHDEQLSWSSWSSRVR